MSGPLPLRLWCLAAMAPALTDAASQARAKLSSQGQSVNGRDCPSPQDLQPATPASPEPAKLAPQLVSLCKQGLMLPNNLERNPKNLVQGKTLSPPLTHPQPVHPSQTSGRTVLHIQSSSKSNGLTAIPIQLTGMNGSGDGGGKSLPAVPSTTSLPASQGPTSIQGGLPQLVMNGTSNPAMGFINKISPASSSQGAPPPTTSTAPLAMAPLTDPGVQSSELSDAGELHYQEIGDGGTVQTSINQGVGMAEVGVLSNVDLVAEAKKRQRELERKAARLTRRLRCLQSRQAVSHIQKQLSGLVDHQHRNLQNVAKKKKVPTATLR